MAARPRKTSYTNFSDTTGGPSSEDGLRQLFRRYPPGGFVEDHGFDCVMNTFPVLTEEGAPRLVASVSFPCVMSAAASVSEVFSDHIDMWGLPAH